MAAASAQLDSGKWLLVDGIYEVGWCTEASQASVANNTLTLTTVYGATTCQGHSLNYIVGAVISTPFSFTYGKVVVVGKFAPKGVHSTIWMWGGAPGTSGYPQTCIAAIRAHGDYMGSCMTDMRYAYEIDIAELMPGNTNGLQTLGNNTHIWRNRGGVGGSNNSYNADVDLSQSFHAYELDWSSTTLTFKMDGTTTSTISLDAGTFNQPMFLILDQEIDAWAGSIAPDRYPLMTQFQSVQVWDQNNNLIFSDTFGPLATNATMTGNAQITGKASLL
jgi:beta-glucanase (GH16 family)